MHTELKKTYRRVRKLSMVWKTVATHQRKEINHLRALEKLAAWRRGHGFDGCDVFDRQWKVSSNERVCSGDDSNHSQIDVDFCSRMPPSPENNTASMRANVNDFKEEALLSQPPQPSSGSAMCPREDRLYCRRRSSNVLFQGGHGRANNCGKIEGR